MQIDIVQAVLWILIGIGLLFLVACRFVPKAGIQVLGQSADRRVMAIVVSLVVGGSALYMILTKQYAGESEKWAFGVVGTIIGFWLRPE